MKRVFRKIVTLAGVLAGVFCCLAPSGPDARPLAAAAAPSVREIYPYPFDDPDRLTFVSAREPWSLTVRAGRAQKTFFVDARSSRVRGVSSASPASVHSAIVQICDMGYDFEAAVGCVFGSALAEIERWLCAEVDVEPVPARVVRGEPIAVTADRDGVAADRRALYRALDAACAAAGEGTAVAVDVPLVAVRAEDTQARVAARTRKLSEFSTSIASSSADRKHNVRLALAAFAFFPVAAGETVSFNAVVGPRTEARGYRTAKVILNGEYADGVGGGVCQASTTLYNALLLGGMRIEKVCRHSLAPSYVAPSRDAMVNSSTADLVWTNPTDGTVYLVTRSTDSAVTVALYGAPTGTRYAIESELLSQTPPPSPEVVVDDGTYASLFRNGAESVVVRQPHPALVSRSFLVAVTGGVRTRTLLRKDVYNAVRAKIIIPFDADLRRDTAETFVASRVTCA